MNRAFFVDPATVIAVAEAGYKMWKSSQEARQQKATIRLLKEINAKLDVVIAKQDEILNELREMKVYFREELRRQFLDEVQFGMASHRDSLEVITSIIGIDNKAALSRVEELELPTRNFSFNLLQRGVGAFTVAIPAAVLHIAVLNLMRELGAKTKVINALELAYLDQWEEQFLKWFKPDAPDGLLYPLRVLAEAREKLEAEISGYPRRIDRGSIYTGRDKSTGSRTTCEIHRIRTLVITGDIQSSFADYYEDGPDFVSKRCYTEPRNRFGPSAGAIPSALFDKYDFSNPLSLIDRDQLLQLHPTGSFYDNAQVIAFGKLSDLPIPVNDKATQVLNEIRLQWINSLESETNYSSFLKIVQDTRGEFAMRAKELR